MNHECATDRPGSGSLSAGCQKFLRESQKAHEEWKLEQKFVEFEAKY
jgi:hypothetical protein